MHLINIRSSCCYSHTGILVNKDGIPEEEENFDEAIKAVNMALVPTRVMYPLKSLYFELGHFYMRIISLQLIEVSLLHGLIHLGATSSSFSVEVAF